MFALTGGTVIQNGADASRILEEFERVQYAAVCFAGKAPESWAGFNDDEGNWAALSAETAQAMTADLKTAIQKGNVSNVCLSFEPWGEDYFLSADFENGWMALLYNATDECAAALYDSRRDGSDIAPVSIGGQTPVPKMCALDDFTQAAEVIAYFLEHGRFHPAMQWAILEEPGLPWTES